MLGELQNNTAAIAGNVQHLWYLNQVCTTLNLKIILAEPFVYEDTLQQMHQVVRSADTHAQKWWDQKAVRGET